MTRAFYCGMCVPGCILRTDEDDIDPPVTCPWPNADAVATWTEAEP